MSSVWFGPVLFRQEQIHIVTDSVPEQQWSDHSISIKETSFEFPSCVDRRIWLVTMTKKLLYLLLLYQPAVWFYNWLTSDFTTAVCTSLKHGSNWPLMIKKQQHYMTKAKAVNQPLHIDTARRNREEMTFLCGRHLPQKVWLFCDL